jgi:hypothetical protein
MTFFSLIHFLKTNKRYIEMTSLILNQGCQIFLDTIYQNGGKQHYQMAIKIPNDRKIFQMAIKYTNIFHSKILQNLPKSVFLFENKPSGNPVLNALKSTKRNGIFSYRLLYFGLALFHVFPTTSTIASFLYINKQS